MGGINFLPEPFTLPDRSNPSIQHDVELVEKSGDLFLRVWIGGVQADNAVECLFTKAQAEQFARSAEKLATRLGF